MLQARETLRCMTASEALPAVLDKIDADLDKSLEPAVRLPADPVDLDRSGLQGPMPRGRRFRRQGSRPASASTPALRPTAGHPVVVGKSGNGATAAAAARASCSTATTTCSRSIRSTVGDAAVRAAHRDAARRPQDHRRARRLRRQRPGDDLRRGLPRLQGGDRQAAAADHHDDRGRGGVRLERTCSASSRTTPPSSSATSRWSATPACGTRRRR